MVLDDPAAARTALAQGSDVVLILAPDVEMADRQPGPPGPGRLAVMVGDPADPAVRRAAGEMDAELFAGVTSRR